MDKEGKNTRTQETEEIQLAKTALKKIRQTKDKKKRLRIIQSLFRNEAHWALEVLMDALADPSEKIRNYIARRLANHNGLDPTCLYKRLSQPPWNVKIEILKVLGLKKDSVSAKYIAAVLDDPNVEVRKTAAEVLGQIGGKEANAFLVQLAKDDNPFVRRAAKKALLQASDVKFT
jgi:HEAT repeat protein